MVFGLSALFLVTLTLGARFSNADDAESLEEIMEAVQKNNLVITKGTRNPAAFKKAQKDVEESAKKLAALAKKAKAQKDAAENAKDVTEPVKKWEEFCDAFLKSSEDLAELVGKADVTQAQAKASFNKVKKSCAECHNVFRVDEEF
jgi:cytochrome c556